MSAKLSRVQLDNLECDIIEYIVAGMSRSQIISKVVQLNPKLDEGYVSHKYEECKKQIQERTSLSAEEVINLHVIWYEDLFKKMDALDSISGKNAALRQKEKILGLLKEENILKVENEVNITLNKVVEYDINKLTPEEQKRLQEYLKIVC